MTKEERARDIKIICGKRGCSEKMQKLHYHQFVIKNWQPHASLRFKEWWFEQNEFKQSQDQNGNGISPVIAQNVARIWNAYLEAKQSGVA